jgi:membrane-bound lytic murein transglycosylase B
MLMQNSGKFDPSLRLDRRALLRAGLSLPCLAAGAAFAEDFTAFVQGLWPTAQAVGVSREPFDAATKDLTLEAGVLSKPQTQAEFTVSIPAYVAGAATSARVARGRTLAGELDHLLRALERRYGVPGEILLAILGIESNFGTATGGADVLRVLATLAFKGHMRQKLSTEFAVALLLLQEGVPRRRLKGSWAGAMGMPQFMPSAYQKYAVSFTGKGAADIWASQPDALASIASFLKESGWNAELPWGVEARIPEGFDFAAFDLDFSQFGRLGFVSAQGESLPAQGAASLYLPAGAAGPAFLIGDNFEVIRQYNTSDAYALSVALLAERIAGRVAPATPWPKVAPLSTAQCVEMQRALTRSGFYHGPLDGKLGRTSRNAVHAFQLSEGIQPADGFATKALVDRIVSR